MIKYEQELTNKNRLHQTWK